MNETILGIVEKLARDIDAHQAGIEDASTATQEIVGLVKSEIDNALLLRKTRSKLMGPSMAKACVDRISGLAA